MSIPGLRASVLLSHLCPVGSPAIVLNPVASRPHDPQEGGMCPVFKEHALIIRDFDTSKNLLLDVDNFSNKRNRILEFPPFLKKYRSISDSLSAWLAFSDAPLHTQLKLVYTNYFSQEFIDDQKDMVTQVVQEVTNQVAQSPGHRFDLLHDWSYPITLAVTARVIGFPLSDLKRVQEYSGAVARFIGLNEAIEEKASREHKLINEYIDYCLRLVATIKTQPPQNNFISKILHSTDERERLFVEHNELLAYHLIDLIYAGHANIVNTMATGVTLLLLPENEAELLKLKQSLDSSEAVEMAVEELLRITSPTQMLGRETTTSCKIGSHELKKGDPIGVCLFQANRDPARFPEPHRLRVDRKPNPHLSFGGGPHLCVGRNLARLEARIAIPALLRRLPALRLEKFKVEDDLPFTNNYTFQSLGNIPVIF